MRTFIMGAAILLFGAAGVWSAARHDMYVTPSKADIKAFAKKAATAQEKPVFTAKTGEWLLVLETRGDRLKVRDSQGNTGWINKASVRERTPSESMTFENANVYSYLDNPAPIYIIDANNPSGAPIKLERSFAREMRENIDRPTANRILGINRPRL